MKVGGVHLGYCTNIHAGESWDEVRRALGEKVTAVKARVAPDRPFGVGLRLSAAAATELAEPGALAEFRAFLDEAGLYVYTINGFPYGAFHGTRVKERVYLPDWLDEERVAYSDALAGLLAALLPAELADACVSTVPVAFKPRVPGAAEAERAAELLLEHAARLAELADATGKTITLALEPEPACHLETIAETIAFFQERLYRKDEDLARRHLGVCFDACHMAVEWEEPAAALARLAAAGIRVAKFQISAGLEVDPARDLGELAKFAEGTYLHQVVERDGARMRRWTDLPEALAAGGAGTWRIHFHVPLHREALGPFRSTQAYLRTLIPLCAAACPHLEVETYTWEVLPEEHRRDAIEDSIAREVQWVARELTP